MEIGPRPRFHRLPNQFLPIPAPSVFLPPGLGQLYNVPRPGPFQLLQPFPPPKLSLLGNPLLNGHFHRGGLDHNYACHTFPIYPQNPPLLPLPSYMYPKPIRIMTGFRGHQNVPGQMVREQYRLNVQAQLERPPVQEEVRLECHGQNGGKFIIQKKSE